MLWELPALGPPLGTVCELISESKEFGRPLSQLLPWSWERMVATWALLSAFHHVFLFRRVNRTLFFQQAGEFWQASSQASAVGNPRGCEQPSFQHKPGVQLPFVLQTRWLKSS